LGCGLYAGAAYTRVNTVHTKKPKTYSRLLLSRPCKGDQKLFKDESLRYLVANRKSVKGNKGFEMVEVF